MGIACVFDVRVKERGCAKIDVFDTAFDCISDCCVLWFGSD